MKVINKRQYARSGMELAAAADSKSASPFLSSPRQLLVFAVLIPAAVALSNQMLLISSSTFPKLRLLVYPWMAASTAALSWCAGRYLSPAWLGGIVFIWCLALLDLLTITAGLAHRIQQEFGYVLVSAQISLLMLWAILGPGSWQLRLPAVAAFAPLAMIFSGSFIGTRRMAQTWNFMMLFTTLAVALLCAGLRYRGFALDRHLSAVTEASGQGHGHTYQFGTRHMLIWLTVTGPLLLFVRSIDFERGMVFPAALLAVSLATVNLLAIWAVLGGGNGALRLVSLALIPSLIALGLELYSNYVNTMVSTSVRLRRSSAYQGIYWIIRDMDDLWVPWFWLNAALVAALLLFVRANGYRLLRAAGTDPMEQRQ
jgi:hypothetical protein